MKILDGKKLAEKTLKEIKKEIQKQHLSLRLVVVRVGKNSVSDSYIGQKKKACERAGIDFKTFGFPANISQKKLKKEAKKIIKDKDNSGIVVQLPLPSKIHTQEILNLIPLAKDIDCLSEESLGKFYTGNLSILPPVVGAISVFFKEYKINITGKNVVLMGSGRLVGRPLAVWLFRKKATFTVLNAKTTNTLFFTKKADILISGVGKPNLIKGNMIKKETVVIDAGTSIEKGKIRGDVDPKSVAKKAGYLSPVPGGVGPLAVACLIKNLLILKSKNIF